VASANQEGPKVNRRVVRQTRSEGQQIKVAMGDSKARGASPAHLRRAVRRLGVAAEEPKRVVLPRQAIRIQAEHRREALLLLVAARLQVAGQQGARLQVLVEEPARRQAVHPQHRAVCCSGAHQRQVGARRTEALFPRVESLRVEYPQPVETRPEGYPQRVELPRREEYRQRVELEQRVARYQRAAQRQQGARFPRAVPLRRVDRLQLEDRTQRVEPALLMALGEIMVF